MYASDKHGDAMLQFAASLTLNDSPSYRLYGSEFHFWLILSLFTPLFLLPQVRA